MHTPHTGFVAHAAPPALALMPAIGTQLRRNGEIPPETMGILWGGFCAANSVGQTFRAKFVCMICRGFFF